jgi:hypothetical protein
MGLHFNTVIEQELHVLEIHYQEEDTPRCSYLSLDALIIEGL